MKKAFTLAEVLITLGIIGVVAAITMPTLISNYKKQVYVNQLKKAVSTVEQGFQKMLADEGVSNLADIPILNYDEGYFFQTGEYMTDDEKNYLKKYFNILKFADADEVYSASVVKRLDNGDYYPFTDEGFFYLSDGTLLGLDTYRSVDDKYLGVLVIDINGDKKFPNQFGRDIFYFWLMTNGHLIPANSSTNSINSEVSWADANACGSDPNSSDISGSWGGGCAARIIESGWKMNY